MIEWWHGDEFFELIDTFRDNSKVLRGPDDWEALALRQEVLKEESVAKKDYAAAAFHRDMREFLRSTHKTQRHSESMILLGKIFHGEVRWEDEWLKHHNLMEQAAKLQDFDSAVFHRKMKEYAERVFLDTGPEGAPGPGQAWFDGIIRGTDPGRA